MGSTLRTILETIRDVLRADHRVADAQGNTGFNDLSDVDAVKIGRYMAPPTSGPVFVCVAPPTVSSQPDAMTLRDHAYVAVFDVQGWVATADDPEARAAAACDLESDILRAVKNSRRDTGGALRALNVVRNITFALTAIDGDEADLAPGYGIVFGTVSVEIAKDRGL